MRGNANNGMLTAQVPVVLLQHMRQAPDALVQLLDATVLFADVSGFTRLSEKLARTGKEGAERLTDVINACFSALLAEAYENGASLIKFGGDAMLLWFDGGDHAGRACTAAVAMRNALREHVRGQSGPDKVTLRMSIGIHSGRFETFLVGGSHHEFLIAGPDASKAVAMEAIADTGQIVVSNETASLLPATCLGARRGPATVISRSPMNQPEPRRNLPRAPLEMVASCLSTALRAHLLAAPAAPEHRNAAIAFLQFGTFDEVIVDHGAEIAAEQLDELVRAAQEAADSYEVCFLGSDIAVDGGKILLSAGAPRAVGDDTERLLLALRQVIESNPRLPIRAGVNRGHVFAGEVGPFYRRTYTLMGDAVNLAARLCAKAPWGSIYATPSVMERSVTRFELTAVPPFIVKGKSRPVTASEVGRALGAASGTSKSGTGLPLIGRDEELAVLEQAVADARLGNGSLVELVGETGSGKSRLAAEARRLADGMPAVHAVCEAYTQTTPYAAWRDPLRQLLGLTRNDGDGVVVRRLRENVESHHPGLVPWLPLLAIPFGTEAAMTDEVRELSEEFRSTKLHETVLAFISRALRVPTLVEIEHAHLMDEASAALLHALAAALSGSSWLVVVTRRDTHGGFEGEDALTQRLELGPLSREAAMGLAEATPEAHVMPPHMLKLAVERSGGSPEFLLDLLSAAAGGSGVLPDSIEAAASTRIDALDPADRVLVRRAALLGLMFDPRRLEAVLEPGSRPPDAETWQRLKTIFATEPDGRLRFKRPALCEVAYDGLPFGLRRRLHGSVGEALERDLGQRADAEPAVLSLHFSRAGDMSRAWSYALLGANRATERFAHADAAHLYRVAIEAGRSDVAAPAELASTWESLAEALRHSGQPTAASSALTEARSLTTNDPVAQGRLLFAHGDIAARSERLSAAVRWINRGLKVLDGVESREASRWRAALRARLAGVRLGQGKPAAAAALCEQVIGEAEAAGEGRALARACYLLDSALVELGREQEAVHSERALSIYRELGDRELEAMVLNNLGAFAYFRGEWDEAVELYRQSAECSVRAGNAANPAFADTNIGEILSDQGRLAEADTLLQRARRVWSATGDQQSAAVVDVLLGRLAVRQGNVSAGLVRLETALGTLRRLGMDGYAEWATLLIAEAEAFVGDPARALEIVGPLHDTTDWYVALVHRIQGVAQGRLGNQRVCVEELQTALAAARERSSDYDVALALNAIEAFEPDRLQGAAERDSISARLGIQRLTPEPDARLVTAEHEPALAGS